MIRVITHRVEGDSGVPHACRGDPALADLRMIKLERSTRAPVDPRVVRVIRG